jgi:hypothetical protein
VFSQQKDFAAFLYTKPVTVLDHPAYNSSMPYDLPGDSFRFGSGTFCSQLFWYPFVSILSHDLDKTLFVQEPAVPITMMIHTITPPVSDGADRVSTRETHAPCNHGSSSRIYRISVLEKRVQRLDVSWAEAVTNLHLVQFLSMRPYNGQGVSGARETHPPIGVFERRLGVELVDFIAQIKVRVADKHLQKIIHCVTEFDTLWLLVIACVHRLHAPVCKPLQVSKWHIIDILANMLSKPENVRHAVERLYRSSYALVTLV